MQNKMHRACTSVVTQDRSNNALLRTSHVHLRKLYMYGWPSISSMFLFELLLLRGRFRLLFNLGVYGGIPSNGLTKM